MLVLALMSAMSGSPGRCAYSFHRRWQKTMGCGSNKSFPGAQMNQAALHLFLNLGGIGYNVRSGTGKSLRFKGVQVSRFQHALVFFSPVPLAYALLIFFFFFLPTSVWGMWVRWSLPSPKRCCINWSRYGLVTIITGMKRENYWSVSINSLEYNRRQIWILSL